MGGAVSRGPTMTSSSKAIAACALMVFICIGTLTFWSEVTSENDRGWVTHSHLVVERLQAVVSPSPARKARNEVTS